MTATVRTATVALAAGAVLAGTALVPASAASTPLGGATGPVASAVEGWKSSSYDLGFCGRLHVWTPAAKKVRLKVGQPADYPIRFHTERDCDVAAMLRPMGIGKHRGAIVTGGPDGYVNFPTPAGVAATVTWTLTGTRKSNGFVVARVNGGGRDFGIRLHDVVVR